MSSFHFRPLEFCGSDTPKPSENSRGYDEKDTPPYLVSKLETPDLSEMERDLEEMSTCVAKVGVVPPLLSTISGLMKGGS